MPRDSAYTLLSGQMSETVTGRMEARGSSQWLPGLLSDWRVADRGKLTATAALALLRGRNRRRLLLVSALFVYNYVIIVEFIVGFLVLAEVAARLIPLFTPTEADRGVLPIGTTARSTGSNDGGGRAGPNRGGRRQQEAIQNHLQQLAIAAAAADVAPSLPHHHQPGQTVEYPERNGTTLAVSNPPPPAASPSTTTVTPRQSHNSDPDLSTIVRSQQRRNRRNATQGPGKSLQETEESLVIHFQFPIYVCDLTFWNDIQITVPSSSRPSSPPSRGTAAKRGSNGASASDASGHFNQIEMRMWMEMNRDMAAGGTRNGNRPCEDCLMCSHSVGKRRFDCTYLDGCLDGALDVHKNTFHAGRKLTILGSNSGLSFKFKTALEQTHPRPGSTGPAAIQQRVTFTLLPRTSKPNGQSSTGQQKSKVDGGGSSPKRQGGSGSGLLAAVFRRTSNSNSSFSAVAKCSVEAHYTLEDRRQVTRGNGRNSQLSWNAPSLGQGKWALARKLLLE